MAADRSLVADRRGPHEAAGGGEQLEAVVDPALGEVVEPGAAEVEREVGDEEREADRGSDGPRAHEGHLGHVIVGGTTVTPI